MGAMISSPHPSTSPGLWRNLGILLGLTLLTGLVFGQSLHYGYIEFDDDLYVENNPELTRGLSLEGVRWAFSANFLKISRGAEYWEPLTLLTRLADYQFYGFDPAGHHRTSVLIHLSAGFALFGMLQSLTGRFWESGLVAALFLIHPMHVEPVCWLSARKDLVSGLFYILALWAYAAYGKKPGITRYVVLLVAFTAANMAKPMAVSLPFLFCLLDFWPLRRWQDSPVSPRWPVWKLLAEKLPFLLIASLVSALAYLTQRGMGAIADTDLLPLPWRLGNAVLATGTYLFKAFIPNNLALLYPHPGKNLNLVLTALSGVILCVLGWLFYRARHSRPWLGIGFLWFGVVLGPVIGIIQIGDQAMADRYSYLAFIGIFIAGVWEISDRLRLSASRRPAVLAGAGAIVYFSSVAFFQVQTWENSLTAFTHAVEVTKDNYVMEYNLGSELLKSPMTRAAALEHVQRANLIRAPINRILLEKADADLQAGRYPIAIQRMKRVLMVRPWDHDLHLRLGEAYQRNRQENLSRSEYLAAIHYRPDLVAPRIALAESLLRDGKMAEAQTVVAAARQIAPEDPILRDLEKKLPSNPSAP